MFTLPSEPWSGQTTIMANNMRARLWYWMEGRFVTGISNPYTNGTLPNAFQDLDWLEL